MEIIRGDRANAPLIHIHHIERTVHGNGIAIKVYGEMLIAAKEFVYARELKLNTIECLQLTPKTGIQTRGYMAQKWIHNPGEYDNYASINVYDMDGNEITAGSPYAPDPDVGSIWLDYEALGE